MLSTIAALLVGFTLGCGADALRYRSWRDREVRLRRTTVGVATRTLVAALARLQETIERVALDPELVEGVERCRDLATALERLAGE